MTPERKEKIQALLNKRQNDLTVVLENVFDPHNIAAVMRTCDAVGIFEIFVINTRQPVRNKWGDRSSASANKWLPVHVFTDTAACFETVKIKYPQILGTHLSSSAKDLYHWDLKLPSALVFGNEREGLSREALSYCTGNFIIPQSGIVQSLNISVACAVSIYEAYRQKNEAGHYNNPKLSKQDTQFLLNHWQVHEAL